MAHPRSRGENSTSSTSSLTLHGSSPLTRGKHQLIAHTQFSVRLIPAHAGKTLYPTKPRPHLPAHPRSRGENSLDGLVVDKDTGSSPLTRGKPGREHHQPVASGLIPAHAGKTPSWRPPRLSPPAHPRSRGENLSLSATLFDEDGSSPLTRGKRAVSSSYSAGRGLIPAHAGKTSRGPLTGRGHTAHPRSRGENAALRVCIVMSLGSSPLTRGKQASRRTELAHARLIPAHAGKTSHLKTSCGCVAAHPRSRGENKFCQVKHTVTRGSSPLTRGKPDGKLRTTGMSRLIPAHAGKTPAGRVFSYGAQAHPRSRGENTPRRSAPTRPRGSSPLTRGKRIVDHGQHGRRGLIPAHAGKTLPDLRFYCADRSDLGNP